MAEEKRIINDYVTRLSARTGREWSKKLITLPDDLHERMVREAEKIGIPMYDAYGQRLGCGLNLAV
jgi:hypothetical protein